VNVTIVLAAVDSNAKVHKQGNKAEKASVVEAGEDVSSAEAQAPEDLDWFRRHHPKVGNLMKNERRHKIGSTVLLDVTAYTAADDENGGYGDMAASNKRVRPGTVAVSRDLFKQGWRFGKKIHIHGMGTYVINDLMSRHQRRKIDVFLTDRGKALQFGVKQKKITLLAE
jgi:3D (Asp-Asp-Asp) domain-containing protein